MTFTNYKLIKTLVKATFVFFFIVSSINIQAQTKEIPFTLDDRDRIIQIEEKLNSINQSIYSINERLNHLGDEIIQIRDEMKSMENSLRGEINTLRDDINSNFKWTLAIILGSWITMIGTFIGFFTALLKKYK